MKIYPLIMLLSSAIPLVASAAESTAVPALVASRPTKYALIVGGSGEDFKVEDQFKNGIFKMADNLRARGWDVTVLYAGIKHRVDGISLASNQNIDRAIEKILDHLQPQDEVLFYINAHGMKQKTVSTDFNAKMVLPGHNFVTETPDGYSTQNFQIAAQKAKEKGAVPAIVDLSCFSGLTQTLEHNYCTVTLASRSYISAGICSEKPDKTIADFTQTFTDFPDRSQPVNLENQFLTARKQDLIAENLPQISSLETPARLAWDDLWEVVDPASISEYDGFVPGLLTLHDFSHLDKTVASLSSAYEVVTKSPQTKGKESLLPIQAALMSQVSAVSAAKKAVDSELSKLQQIINAGLDWGMDTPYFNDVSLAEVKSVLEMTEALEENRVALDQISWIKASWKKWLRGLMPYSKNLKAACDAVFKDPEWEKYAPLKAKLYEESKRLMNLERKYYDAFTAHNNNDSDHSCRDFIF